MSGSTGSSRWRCLDLVAHAPAPRTAAMAAGRSPAMVRRRFPACLRVSQSHCADTRGARRLQQGTGLAIWRRPQLLRCDAAGRQVVAHRGPRHCRSRSARRDREAAQAGTPHRCRRGPRLSGATMAGRELHRSAADWSRRNPTASPSRSQALAIGSTMSAKCRSRRQVEIDL